MLVRRVLVCTAALVAALSLFGTAPAAAQQPADQATINNSINRGVKFLKQEQKAAGFWGTGATAKEANGIGYTSLAGLTLVECGVPTTDPGLKRAANIVRGAAGDLDSIYELSLAILFLDRMKDKNGVNDKTDIRIIQLLAGRLIASQMPSGGWGYKAQKYGEPNIQKLVAALNKVKAGTPEAPADVTKIRSGLPEDMRRLPIWTDPAARLPADPKDKGQDLYDATTDNSTTHFAMIGLWAARKHDIPVDRTFALVNRRFRTTQGPGGTWAYPFVSTGADGGNQFTCIALLGVAIGHVVAPEPGVKPETDPVIINAFAALSKVVGAPVGDTRNRPTVKDAGGLYFLWAMERIAVLYDLQKLNNKDWYLWGAEILVCHQVGDGSWADDGGFPGQSPIVNTCLSLLFLKRANLTPDLSKKLTVNTAALTAKVDDKIEPKVAPKVETPPVSAPKEEPKVEPKAEPKVEPKAEPKVEVKPAVVEPEPTPPAKKSPLLAIVLGVLGAAVVLGGLAFFLLKRKKGDEDDEDDDGNKKKKKGKKKAKATTAKKAKSDVEVDEDD